MLAFARTEDEVASVQRLRQMAASFLKDHKPDSAGMRVVVGEAEVVLPQPMIEVLLRAAEFMEAGRGVDVVSPDQELSVQEAADQLNVSRPYVMILIRQGEIPYRMVGTHHRIQLEDVLAYKRAQAPRRRIAIDNLVRQTEELGH